MWEIDLTGTPGAVTLVGAFPAYGDYESVGCLTAGSNVITGMVFCEPVDSFDGIFNAGDTPQNGATVRLYVDDGTTPDQVDGSDTFLVSYVTGPAGTYDFEIGIAGNFVIDIDPAIIPLGAIYTVPTTPGNDHDADFINTGPPFSEYGNTDSDNDFGFTCAAPTSDVAVTKTDSPDPIVPGNDLTYSIAVVNNGPSAATNVSWSDPLPAGTTFVSVTEPGGWSCTDPGVGNPGTVSCSIASLAVGGPYTFTLVVNVPADYSGSNPILNTVTVGAENDSDPNNNNDTEDTSLGSTASDVAVTKTDSPDPIVPGNDLTYSIAVINNGPDAAINVSWSDPLPAGTTFVSVTEPGGWSCTDPGVGNPGTVSCSIASLAVGGPYTFTLVVNVPADYSGSNPILNTVTVGAENDSDPNNNNDTEDTSLGSTASDVAVTKTDSPDPITPGNDLTYSIAVVNNGPDAAINVSWSDPLPAGTTFVSVTEPGGWTCTDPGVGNPGTVSCSIASLAVGGPYTFTLVVNVPADYSGGDPILNTVTVGAENDSDPNNNNDTEETDLPGIGPDPIILVFDPALSKIGVVEEGGLGLPGETITWIITATNIGTGTGADIVVSDTIQDELQILNVTTERGTSVINGQTVTFLIPYLDPGESVQMTITTLVLTSPVSGQFENTAILTGVGPNGVGVTVSATAVLPAVGGLPDTGYPPVSDQ